MGSCIACGSTATYRVSFGSMLANVCGNSCERILPLALMQYRDLVSIPVLTL